MPFAALEAADPTMEYAGIGWEHTDYLECLDLIRNGLHPDELEAARRTGTAMSLHQTVRYALDLLEEAAQESR